MLRRFYFALVNSCKRSFDGSRFDMPKEHHLYYHPERCNILFAAICNIFHHCQMTCGTCRSDTPILSPFKTSTFNLPTVEIFLKWCHIPALPQHLQRYYKLCFVKSHIFTWEKINIIFTSADRPASAQIWKQVWSGPPKQVMSWCGKVILYNR